MSAPRRAGNITERSQRRSTAGETDSIIAGTQACTPTPSAPLHTDTQQGEDETDDACKEQSAHHSPTNDQEPK